MERSKFKAMKEPDRKRTRITRKEAFMLIDDVIDTLIESGNGTTTEMLHEAADMLFIVRDCFIDWEQSDGERNKMPWASAWGLLFFAFFQSLTPSICHIKGR